MHNPVFVGKTNFPLNKKTNHQPFEVDHSLFKYKQSPEGSRLSVFDGPPYANGLPHLGHVMNKYLKDTLAQACSLSTNVSFRPGWDCHGLPVEMAAKKQNKDNPDFRLFAHSQVEKQREEFLKLGVSLEWDNPWTTMDFGFEANTLDCFQRMLEKDCVSLEFTTTPWCVQCGSTLSNAEQEEKVQEGQQFLVPFYLDDKTCLLVWTTTLWSVPLHEKLLVNPNETYQSFTLNGLTYFVSGETFDLWVERLNGVKNNFSKKGTELSGMRYTHSFGHGVVLADEMVFTNVGTGVLHCVPGLSELDGALGEKHHWPLYCGMNERGVLLQTPCEEQRGKKFNDPETVAFLNNRLDVLWSEKYTQTMLSCWRHKTPVVFRPSQQVYLNLNHHRHKVETFLNETTFVPASSKNRLRSFLKGRDKWCVSRQRQWGVPLCLLVDNNNQLLKEESLSFMEKAKEVVANYGVEGWRKQQQMHVPKNTNLVNDVLDVWFDSGCVPQYLNTQGMACEGTDQHRGWFQSCYWVSALLDQPNPFSLLVTHGFVVDDTGEKFAKSNNNHNSKEKGPTKWQEQPLDVVRLWSLSGTVGGDRTWNTETVQQAQKRYQHLRLGMRFLLSNFQKDFDVLSLDQLDEDDLYFVGETMKAVENSVHCARSALFNDGLQMMLGWTETLSKVAFQGWKDRLYCAHPNTAARLSVQSAVYYVLSHYLKFAFVYTPELFKEVFLENLFSAETLQNLWNEQPPENLDVAQKMGHLLAMRDMLNKKLEESKLPRNRVNALTPVLPLKDLRRLADYWDVGEVTFFDTDFSLTETTKDVCPRCRRPGDKLDLWCETCEVRRLA